jgi:hypothetical protein
MDLAGWEERFSRIRRTTLLQSYEYARAVCPIYGQKPRWGLIRINGAEAGLVQCLDARLMGLHGLHIDRGPLWFQGFGGAAHWKAFLSHIDRTNPRRFGRKRRLIVEMADSPGGRALMTQSGWVFHGPLYHTIWLDLNRDLEAVRADLRKNWRNALARAERAGMDIVWDDPGASLDDLVARYDADRRERRYPGPSPRIVRALGRVFLAAKKASLGWAMLDNRPVAAILILHHGTSATYQIGWCDAEGRRAGAHNLLLFRAIARLQERGITDLDLGGVEDDSAKGVSDFKDGLGGNRWTLAGLYR